MRRCIETTLNLVGVAVDRLALILPKTSVNMNYVKSLNDFNRVFAGKTLPLTKGCVHEVL